MRNSQLGVQVIARAADVLRALEGNEQGLSLGQLSRQLDLPKSTVQRIVAALDRENFVIAGAAQGVRLGPALARIGRSVRFGLVDSTRPFLEDLAQRTGETVDLAVLKGQKAVFLDHIEGRHRLLAVLTVGLSGPLYCSASGKAILASLDAKQLDQMKRTLKLEPHTDNTLCDWTALDAELDKIRQNGVALDFEEHTLGICAVGASFIGPEGEIAAISVPTPTVRFQVKRDELVAAMSDCRKVLAERFSRV